jgi:glucose-1-phosphate thymidylyltransferase
MARSITKAVILARGLGKRMREPDERASLDAGQARYADAGLKAMIPIARPFLDYVLSGLADAGYGEACLVIGPEHDEVQEYYTRTAPPRRLRIDFAIQKEPRGTADAVLAAEAFTAGEEFLVMNADNYYPTAVLRQLRELGEPGTVLFEREALIRESNIPAERVRAYGFAVIRDGYLEDLIEKPDDAAFASLEHAPVSMNVWRFGPAIFDICRKARLAPRGEYELPSAIGEAVRSGRLRLKARCVAAGVLDLSRRADIATVAQRLRGIEANP